MTGQHIPNGGPDPYAILGIDPDATAGQVTRAFQAQARRLHPDTADHLGPDTTAELDAVLAAYRILRDPSRRAEYDRIRTRVRTPVVRSQSTTSRGPLAARTADDGLIGLGTVPAGPDVAIWIGPPVWIQDHRPGGRP